MTPGQQGRQYDLASIYKDAFGQIRPPYPTVVIESRTVGYSPVGLAKRLRGAFSFSSKLGSEFTFPTTLNGYQLPNEPTLRISGSKTIKETKLTRLDSFGQLNKHNVLEEINMNNYRIRLRGLMINEDDPDEYPEDQMRSISDICTAAGSVTIDNAICQILGIQRLAIEDFEFNEVRGNISVQAYDIIGYSDEDVNLEIVDAPEQL